MIVLGCASCWISMANLEGANLAGAVFTQANLTRANLFGADLRWAIANEDTSWPEGFDPEAAGVIFD